MLNKFISAMIISFCFSAGVFAAGVANNTIGLQETERCSFVGVANDSSSVAHNPAGLTNIASGKIDAEIGALYNFTKFTYEDTDGKEHKSTEPVILPAAFAAMSFDNIAFGFGVYVPNGSGTINYTDVPLVHPTLGNIVLDVKGETYSLAFAPAVAYKILPALSIGLTLDFFYGKSYIKQNIDYAGGNMKIDEKTDGFDGIDLKLGLFGKLNEALSFGLTIKTPSKLETKGTRKTYNNSILISKEEITITERIPWYFMSGIGYKILPHFDASLDFGYRLWNKYEKIVKKDGTKDSASSVDKDTWKNAYVVGIGIKYGIIPVLDIIAGIMYIPTGKKDKDVSFPETDFNQTISSLSVAYRIIQRLELHFGCAYVHSIEKRNVPGNGKVDSNTFYLNAGVRSIF